MSYTTVRATTSPELTYLRSAGQWSKLYLAIFKPNVIYTAMVVHPGASDRIVQVGFTGGSGTLANVRKDMTMYVGSTAGAYDLGIARIRKTPIAGTFYIGEESDINWQVTSYLTVVDEFDLWARHINTISDTVFHMDYDIAYTDQNINHDPVPIMGGHRVLKLTGATVATTFDFSNSYVIGSTISAYSVGSPTSSLITNGSTSTPTITFNTTGWHPVYLTVTAANGKTYTGVRYVYVYSTSAMPATVFQLGECSEDYETGGWTFTVTMQDEIALANVPDRTMCILFAEDHYGDTQISIGQLAGCENIICVGKIAEEGISINPEQSEVTLRVQGYQYWLNQVFAFPTGLIQVTTTPTNWAEIQSPTVDKVAFHLLHWASTATTIMDCYLPGDSRIAKELVSPASNLWAQLQELCFASIQARVGVDPYSRLFVEVEPQLVPVSSRSWATVMTITKPDWYDTVNMQRIVVNPTGMVNASGVVVDASANGNALFTLSPGHVFKHYGGTEIVDRLLLSTQALTNQFAGLILGWKNNPYPNNEFRFACNNRMIDCFPRQKVAWSIASGDSPRAFALTGNFIPRRIERSWDPATGFLETGVSLELESVENISGDGDIPGAGDGDPSVPPEPPAFPDLPDFPVVLPTDIPEPATVKVLMHDLTYGMLYCADFMAASPQWITVNAGLSSSQYQNITNFFVCPNGAFYVAQTQISETNGFAAVTARQTFVARAPSVGGTFVVLYEETDIRPPIPGNFQNWGIFAIAQNPLVPEQVAFVMGIVNVDKKIWTGSGSTFAAGAVVDVGSFVLGGLSYGFGNWLYTRTNNYWKIATDGGSVVGSGSPAIGELYVFTPWLSHVRAGSTGRTFHIKQGGSGMVVGDNNLATITTYTNVTSDARGFASDSTGMLLMGNWGAKYKSSDGGATWVALSSLPVGTWYWAYISGLTTASKWVAAGGTSIRLTEDFGSTWIGKEGDYTATYIGGSINGVKVVGVF